MDDNSRPGGQSGVGMVARVNQKISDSLIGGRDILQVGDSSVGVQGTSLINSKLVIKNGGSSRAVSAPAVVLLVLVVVTASAFFVFSGPGIDTGVVSVPGKAGARKTLEALKKAEIAGDAPAWCEIAQPDEANCETQISGVFRRAPESYRDEVGKAGVGDITIKDDTATAMMVFDGTRKGTIRLVWWRNRWQIHPVDYLFGIGANGLYLSIVDSAHGRGPLDGLLKGLGGQ
jgi:hypothetical protein